MAPRCLVSIFALIIGPLYTSSTAQTSGGPRIYSVGQVRRIPDVVGKTFSAATDSLRWTELRIVQLDTVVTSDWLGLVIAQRPRAGTPVSQARAETLYVAVQQTTHRPRRPNFLEELAKAVIAAALDSVQHGEVQPNTTTVPDLFGRTPAMALALLRKSQLTSGETIRDYSDNVEPGRVFRQHPLAGTQVVTGSSVEYWYSAGPHPEDTNLRVPSVLGLTLQEAADSLKRAQLRVGHVDSLTNPDGEGKVLRQTPHEGVTAHPNDAVDLIVVLKAPALVDTVARPPAKTPPPVRVVPDLVGRSRKEARVMADIDSLRMIVTSELRRLRFSDEIVKQTPIAFDTRPSNGTIEVIAEIPVIPPTLAGMLGFTVVAGAGWQALRKKPVKSPKGNVELLSITQPSQPPVLDAAGRDTLISADYALRFDVATDPIETEMSDESIVKSSEVTSV